jgi:uncharacterized membrane protein
VSNQKPIKQEEEFNPNQENNGELKEIEHELISVNPEMVKVLNGLNKTKKEVILRSTSLVIKQHSGPLPDPETLGEYNQLIPNGAERIMRMAEKQQDHGMDMERTALRRASFQHLLGQIFAFILAGVATWFGYELTVRGYEKAGITIFATTIGVILYAFLRKGRRSKPSEK